MQQEKRVLVVDDEPSIRAFVSRVLSRSGFVCSEASNAAETLASVMTSCPMLTITTSACWEATGLGFSRSSRSVVQTCPLSCSLAYRKQRPQCNA